MYFFFFFSSRRRHTRSTRDWSSDVCSSDLGCRRPQRQTLWGRQPTPVCVTLGMRVPHREPRLMSVSGWIVLGIAVVVLLWAIVTYNRLVAMRQQCNQAFADIDVQL